jgi:putative ABC transport system ATP-binding protein
MLRGVVRQERITAIVATHDQAMIDVADRVIELRDGQVIADSAGLGRGD